MNSLSKTKPRDLDFEKITGFPLHVRVGDSVGDTVGVVVEGDLVGEIVGVGVGR